MAPSDESMSKIVEDVRLEAARQIKSNVKRLVLLGGPGTGKTWFLMRALIHTFETQESAKMKKAYCFFRNEEDYQSFDWEFQRNEYKLFRETYAKKGQILRPSEVVQALREENGSNPPAEFKCPKLFDECKIMFIIVGMRDAQLWSYLVNEKFRLDVNKIFLAEDVNAWDNLSFSWLFDTNIQVTKAIFTVDEAAGFTDAHKILLKRIKDKAEAGSLQLCNLPASDRCEEVLRWSSLYIYNTPGFGVCGYSWFPRTAKNPAVCTQEERREIMSSHAIDIFEFIDTGNVYGQSGTTKEDIVNVEEAKRVVKEVIALQEAKNVEPWQIYVIADFPKQVEKLKELLAAAAKKHKKDERLSKLNEIPVNSPAYFRRQARAKYVFFSMTLANRDNNFGALFPPHVVHVVLTQDPFERAIWVGKKSMLAENPLKIYQNVLRALQNEPISDDSLQKDALATWLYKMETDGRGRTDGELPANGIAVYNERIPWIGKFRVQQIEAGPPPPPAGPADAPSLLTPDAQPRKKRGAGVAAAKPAGPTTRKQRTVQTATQQESEHEEELEDDATEAADADSAEPSSSDPSGPAEAAGSPDAPPKKKRGAGATTRKQKAVQAAAEQESDGDETAVEGPDAAKPSATDPPRPAIPADAAAKKKRGAAARTAQTTTRKQKTALAAAEHKSENEEMEEEVAEPSTSGIPRPVSAGALRSPSPDVPAKKKRGAAAKNAGVSTRLRKTALAAAAEHDSENEVEEESAEPSASDLPCPAPAGAKRGAGGAVAKTSGTATRKQRTAQAQTAAEQEPETEEAVADEPAEPSTSAAPRYPKRGRNAK
ncbi:unnamed protein product [Caenorhabditis sp. 36 PRJEB53466]|nr:unnamed protein product [Caenorhabditis sp. 36 PRJEB53466]